VTSRSTNAEVNSGTAQTTIRHARKLLLDLDEHTLEVLIKSSSSLVVRVVGMAAAMGISIVLGRTLGATGVGIVNLTQQIAALLLVVTMLGMDSVITKRVAIGHAASDPEQIASSLGTASIVCGLFATATSVAGILAAPWMANNLFHTKALEVPLIIALAVLVPQTFSRILSASLSGFRKIWQSNLVDNTLSVWIVGVGLIVIDLCNISITVINVAILYAIGRIGVLCSMAVYQHRLFTYSGPRRFLPRPMLKMAFPLLIASSAYLIMSNADGVMLGWLRSPKEVGLYSVAAKIALLESFFLTVSNSAVGPALASLYAQGRVSEIERMVKRVTGGLIVIAMLSLVLFMLFGRALLSIWGTEFAGAYYVLLVLGVGQFFNVSTGCCGTLLTMCGHEKVVGYLSTIFLCLNLVLVYVFVVKWGAVGAACATAITVASENTAKVIIARIKVGVVTIPFIGA